MASYLVLEPPAATDKAEKAVIVRDGFSIPAFVLPLLWFLWHRMWLEALGFLVMGVLLAGLGTLPGFTMLAPLLSVFLYVLIGLEAQALRIASLRRRGWREWGVVEAQNRDEAELRYAAEVGHYPAQRPVVPAGATPANRAAPSAPRAADATFGLIDYPRKS